MKRKHVLFGLPLAAVIALAVILPLLLLGGGGRSLVSMDMQDIWQPGLRLAVGQEGNKPTVRPSPSEEIAQLFRHGKKLLYHGRHHRESRFAAYSLAAATTFQWQQCDANGNNCADIPGATADTYTLTSADAGKTIRVKADGVLSAPYGSVSTSLGSSLPARMPESSGAHTLVSSATGSGTACTLGAPCSVSQAFTNAVSGDIIYSRGSGDYGCFAIQHKNFSATNPVTWTTYPGDAQAVMDGPSSIVQGTCAQLPGQGVEFDDSSGIRIRRITFADKIQGGSLKLLNVKDFEIDGALFRDSGRNLTCRGTFASGIPSCGWGIALGMYCFTVSGHAIHICTNVQIWNSTFTNNGGYTLGNAGDIKHGHASYLCGANGVSNGGCDGLVYANNLIFDSPNGNAAQFGESAVRAFIVNNTIDNTDTRSLTNTLTCTDFSGSAMDVWSSGVTPKSNTVKIRNNVASNNCGRYVFGSTSSNQANVDVSNNLGFHNSYACTWEDCSPEYNCKYGTFAICTAGTNLTDGDPRYTNTTGAFGSITKDFHPLTGSAVFGKSDPSYTPPLDRDGSFRPVNPAVGAYG